VHRSIKAALAGGRYKPGNWTELGAHCSQTERRADEATREVAAWLKCYYMRDRVGEEFEGSVSAVTGFGIFVALDDFLRRGTGAHLRAGAGLFPVRPRPAPAGRRSHPQAVFAWLTGSG